jgi:hypothetical protein
MKIDFSQPLTDVKGKPLKKGEECFTLYDICVDALLGYAANPGQNAELFVLWKKIADSGEIVYCTLLRHRASEQSRLWLTRNGGQLCGSAHGKRRLKP